MIKKLTGILLWSVIMILLGAMIQGKPEIREVPGEKIWVPFLDLTLPEEERIERLEAYANTVNRSLYKYSNLQKIKDVCRNNEQELEDKKRKDKQEIEDLYRQRKYEFRQTKHIEYSAGYKAGYQDAMQKK